MGFKYIKVRFGGCPVQKITLSVCNIKVKAQSGVQRAVHCIYFTVTLFKQCIEE